MARIRRRLGLNWKDPAVKNAYHKKMTEAYRALYGRPSRAKPGRYPEEKPETWRCKLCMVEKLFNSDNFYPSKQGHFKINITCKDCMLAKNAAKKYGLTVQEARELKKKSCGICGSTSRIFIDHCHTSGSVRAALCSRCNTGLGMFRDNPDTLRKAAEYVETHAVLA